MKFREYRPDREYSFPRTVLYAVIRSQDNCIIAMFTQNQDAIRWAEQQDSVNSLSIKCVHEY